MLADLIEGGFGIKEDYNCAEKILYGANKVYDLNLSGDALKMASAFGGGMGFEGTCGVITAGLMVIGLKFTETVAHKSLTMRPKANVFLERYQEVMGSIDCGPLKADHKTEDHGCMKVIYEGAKLLDEILLECNI